ncbi:putative Ku family DNA helicase [Stipitochalara longipes BDJ]|nr:putative Ku family DNA helicase [Stipitochalara longipes BDJ]
MAKQATMYIVDLGSTMGECHNGRVETDLDFGMRYIWDKIATTMAANLKGGNLGVIGLRTDGTDNPLDADGYENISVLRPLGNMEMHQLAELRKQITPSGTDAGDAISAIVLAVHMITEFTKLKSGKPGSYARKIVLLTDGQGMIDDQGLASIAKQINECDISLVVIGIDFDDKDFGFKEEDKSSQKQQNESVLRHLIELCDNGVFGTALDAVANLAIPDIKSTKPYSSYEGRLALGDPEKYEKTAMYIDVKRYFCTKIAKPVSAKSFVTKTPLASTQSSNTLNDDIDMTDAPANGDDLSTVRSSRRYRVNDLIAPGGRRDIQQEELARGYEYGRTTVHISESDENVTNFDTVKSFSIIGFIPSDKYERYLNMGESRITIAQPINDKARMAFSSLVHALFELESYAVARIVEKDGKVPQILLLAPSIEPDLEALIDLPLPFAEDVRVYRFPPLDRVITASGSTLKKHRYLPDDDLVGAMSDYVDSMDLSTAGKDEDGQPVEYMTIEETFTPVIHRINRAIRERAMYPEDPIPPAPEILTQWSQPPKDLATHSAHKLEKLVAAAKVHKVPPKVKGTRGRREIPKPLSGLDVEALLNREKREKISPINTIPEFKQMLASPADDNVIHDAAKQMSNIIRMHVTNSTGKHKYEEAKADMKTFREYMIEFETPEIWNDFIRDFKTRVAKGELGGDRKDLFQSLRWNNLGLIDKQALEISDVTEKEAHEFFSLGSDLPTRSRGS